MKHIYNADEFSTKMMIDHLLKTISTFYTVCTYSEWGIMGLPSSAAGIHADFVSATEPFIPPSASIVETQDGYDVIENSTLLKRGDILLIWFCGRQQHAYWAGDALITDDGEAIEGEALDDVRFVGVVTHTISPVWVDDNPVM